MEPVRIALIGAGGIVSQAHKPAFLRFPDEIRPVAVADPHLPAAQALAAEFGVPYFASQEEMLAGMAVDAVLITTPHYLHAGAAADALRRGIPALVEKPLACTVSELRELEALEKSGGAFVQAGQQQRFGVEENWLKSWLNSPDFGAPRLFNLDIYQNVESYATGKHDPWILDKNRAGGGIVISVAIHILDLLRYWFEDDFVEVCGQRAGEVPRRKFPCPQLQHDRRRRGDRQKPHLREAGAGRHAMKVAISARSVEFSEGGLLAGRYALEDRFKPHFAVLNSPAGHNVTMVSPADHRHHKGLMYALRCADLNFWEEEPGSKSCGVQEIVSTGPAECGFVQEILWREEHGGLETYREVRTITCRSIPEAGAFEWHWHTRRESLRDHRLVKSPWSVPLPDGSTVNYHGLGLRLPWSWAYPHESVAGVEADGCPAPHLMGSTGPSVTMWGFMDGEWAAPKCAVTMRQTGGHAWFVLRQPFAYLAVGPSNAEERDVRRGDSFEETYTITVADR